MYENRDRLVIFDADGTLIDAFPAVELSFARHQMDIGDLERFQRRRKLLKYLGGLREFPKNLRRQFDKDNRRQFKHTLTETYRSELQRHGIDPEALDFLHCIPLGESKSGQFRAVRAGLGINPARAHACGDEYRDYSAAIEAGLHPLVVSYGFEDYRRLTDDFAIPAEVIVRAPEEMAARLCHALDIDPLG